MLNIMDLKQELTKKIKNKKLNHKSHKQKQNHTSNWQLLIMTYEFFDLLVFFFGGGGQFLVQIHYIKHFFLCYIDLLLCLIQFDTI